MSTSLGPFGFLNPYLTGTVSIPSNQRKEITGNSLFEDTGRLLPVGTYAISCCESSAGRWASCALVTVTGTPWTVEPSRQLTAFNLSAMAGQVVANGDQTANTAALTASAMTNAQWIAIGNTTSATISMNYTIIKFA